MSASVQETSLPAPAARPWLPALAGLGSLAASAGAVFVFGDPMARADTAAEAATALAGSRAQPAALLVGIHALLA
ncbi:MAG: hypothetical protein ACLGI3_18935, partial [Actinomycetes bacterium]